jgi:hypothetical protein
MCQSTKQLAPRHLQPSGKHISISNARPEELEAVYCWRNTSKEENCELHASLIASFLLVLHWQQQLQPLPEVPPPPAYILTGI